MGKFTTKQGVALVVAFALGGLLAAQIVNALPAGKAISRPVVDTDPVVRGTAKSWGPYERPTFRFTFVKGAAANTSIYVAGIVAGSDQILEAWTCDSTKMAGSWISVTDSTYLQASDSIRCGTSTATGPVFLFWYDAP